MTPEAESVPVLVADDLGEDAPALIAEAEGAAFVRDSRFYPGVRAARPTAAAEGLARRLSPRLSALLGWPADTGLVPLASHYSMVIDSAGTLSPLQRIPHVDGYDPSVIAVIQYLCGPEQGGTSFFRHRSTGYARLTADRRAAYDAALDRDVARHGVPPEGYMEQAAGAYAAVFERTRTVDCRLGRLVAYPADGLHCGRIPKDASLSAVPSAGRLTLNTFLRRT